MRLVLVMTNSMARELEDAVARQVETAGVLLASVLTLPGAGLRLLARELHWVEPSAYARREAYRLSIRSAGYVPALARAERIGSSAIWLHTHPGLDAVPGPSEMDRVVDGELADLFRIRTGTDYYGALIVSRGHAGVTFSGHLQDGSGVEHAITHIWSVGDRLRLVPSHDSPPLELSDLFDRNVRAFGTAIQETLSQLHVGIVGCGGTGSVVAEQLVRLGVRRLIVVDPDRLTASNVTRVYGSTAADVGEPKVEVLARHLSRIAPSLSVETIEGSIVYEGIARHLARCDVVFGCTDDNAGRLILSRAQTYLMVPVIDCGVVLTNGEAGILTGIDGRVTILTPGQACLVCRGRVDVARAAAELMSPKERIHRIDEGYAPGLGATEPAVVSFNTAVGAFAVSELLERLIGYGPEPRPSEVLLRCHEREVSTNIMLPRSGHYCDPAVGKIGRGITDPFLEQTWR